MLKIVGIAGSARARSNSTALLQSVLEGASSAGCEQQIFYLKDRALVGCRGCQVCGPRDTCRFSDDLDDVFEALIAADIWVLAAPIYYDNVCGQLKTFFDRCRRLTRDGSALTPQLTGPRAAAVVVTYADKPREDYHKACEVLESYLGWMGDFDPIEILAEANLSPAGAAGEKADLLEKASQLGLRLAEKLKQRL